MKAATISLFKSVKATTNMRLGLNMIMTDIRDGQWKDQIEECRAILASKGKDEADKYKKERLPCVTFSGVFRGPHKAEALTVHSGILCLDFDDLGALKGLLRPGLSVTVTVDTAPPAPKP